jgi:hypothetical protein
MISAPPVAFQRRGATFFNNGALPAGNTTIVSAAANTTGLIVRTIALDGRAPSFVETNIGGAPLFGCAPGATNYYLGAGILVPPGVALNVTSGAVNGGCYLTYDIL